MEILISLDRADPPAGRLRVVRNESAYLTGAHDDDGIAFAGWLDLLRAFYEVVGSPVDRPPDAES